MHELYELKEKLLNELISYNQNTKFSKEDAEIMKYLASAIDHMCNIAADMEEEGGSSYRGSSRDGRESGQSRARGRGRSRDSMGRYSNEYGSSRYGSSRYNGGSSRYDGGSYAEDMEQMVESIRGMMGELPQNVQQDAQRFVQKLEQVM